MTKVKKRVLVVACVALAAALIESFTEVDIDEDALSSISEVLLMFL